MNATPKPPRKPAAAPAAAASKTANPFVATPGSGTCAACGEAPISPSMLVCRACWRVLSEATKAAVYDALERWNAEPRTIDRPGLRAVQAAAVREAQAGRAAPRRNGPPLPQRRAATSGEWPQRTRRPARPEFRA